ncbi:MAG: hypothetical protein ACI4EO_06270 [Blautia sp.]
MKKSLNKKTLCLAAVALTLTAGLTAGSAMAYFTTYATADGGQEISLGLTTTVPEETVSDWTKHIVIKNTGDSDCYVRVKIFAGGKYEEGITVSDASGKWTPGTDGYYYYSDILAPGESTEELIVKIDNMDSAQSFNVIVIQECTPVLYDESGNPYADWNVITNSGEESYTNQNEEVGES